MPKDKLTDYDTVNASNTDVGGVNTDEGMLPSAVNNAIREVMTHLKNFASGTDGIDVLSLADDDASHAIKLQAPASVTADTTFTLPDGDGTDGQVLSTDGSGALSFVNTTPAPSLIINGNMAVAQRGTSATSSGHSTVDRFRVDSPNRDQLVYTQSQSTTVPSGQGFSNSFKIEVTTAETTVDSDEYLSFTQKIEAQNLQHLNYGDSSAKSLTLSFWVRSSLTGKYSINIYSQDGNRVNTPSFSISTADTWEYKTITLDGDTAGTINNDNGAGLNFNFVLAAGSNFSSSITSGWQAYTNAKYAHSDQVNFAVQTGTFYITGLKLEVGSSATPFLHESYGENLRKCRRYFETNYPEGKYPGDVVGNTIGAGLTYRTGSATQEYDTHPFKVRKRANPSVVAYNGLDGGTGDWRGSGSTDFSIIVYDNEESFTAQIQDSNSLIRSAFYTADAEL